jgi:beta-glucosidase
VAEFLPDLDDLSLEEMVAQMLVVRASGFLFDHEIRYPAWEAPNATLRHWLEDVGVGGVILLGGSAGELSARSQQLQGYAKVPLLVAADIEEGVGQRFSGATWFPPPMAIGEIARQNLLQAQDYAEQMGAITASEALAIGINWVLAPVVDVNNNPNNPVINVRAFGENPNIVSQLATAFIRGAHQYPVLTSAKHFPGHGDTVTDSHLDLPVLDHSAFHLAEIELPPFAAAIAAGVDTVMSAHLLIPTWDAERPATLSPPILTDLLREQMQFQGLIVTDALVMGAIANRYGANEAPVMAVEAGADILLMPADPVGAIQAVCAAVTSGRLTKKRIRASVERIWQAKGKVIPCLNATEPTSYVDHLAQPAAFSTVTNILEASGCYGGNVPLSLDLESDTPPRRNLIVVDDALDCRFLSPHTPAVALPRQFGYTLQVVDRNTPALAIADVQPTLLQLFIRGNPFRGSAGLSLIPQTLLKKLLETGELQALIVYGSPYVLEQFLSNLPSTTPYIYFYGQMPEAQARALKVLFKNRF